MNPVEQKSNKNVNIWNRLAVIYDRAENKDKKIFDKIILITKEYLTEKDNVLDFGCGTGLISNEIAENVHYVHAIDISDKMLKIAKNKAAIRNIINISYDVADIFDCKLKAGSYDVILASYILHLFDDPEKVLMRIYDLLKPGGVLISATPCMSEKPYQFGFLSFLSKFGFVPEIKSFLLFELVNYISNSKFKIIKKECLQKNSAQYFIAARKL